MQAVEGNRRLGRWAAVRELVPGIHRRTAMRWGMLGLMPAPIKVNRKVVYWDLDAITSWVAGGCKPLPKNGGAK